ncbi:MAG: ATP-binding protein [Candidatus Gastranaerophilales bacterium]|nr:ATP-binding protein [Candidatus Gastranaerophilales bacterium]
MNTNCNLKNYKAIFENLPIGVVICSVDLKILDVNKFFENLSDYTKAEMLDVSLNKLLDNIKKIDFENSVQTEILLKNKNKLPVKISAQKNDEIGIILCISPLSDNILLNQAHIDFVSTVSHELRTPLTSLKGFSETLINSGDKLSNEQQKRFLIIIKDQINRLTRLVENLLTVSKMEAHKNNIYKAINFEKFIHSLIQSLLPKLQNHKIQLNIQNNLPEIWADSDKLEQIFTNLIDNAVKYSKNGTNIVISANYSKTGNNYVKISVTDEGVGIAEEFLPKIFTKFSRIDNPLTREVQGTGLGLYITKTLVNSMNGFISVQSKVGEYTEFIIELPVANYEKQARQHFSGEVCS